MFTDENVYHPGIRSILTQLNKPNRGHTVPNDILEDFHLPKFENNLSDSSSVSNSLRREKVKCIKNINYSSPSREYRHRRVESSFFMSCFMNPWVVGILTAVVLFLLFILFQPSFCYTNTSSSHIHKKKSEQLSFSYLAALLWAFAFGFLLVIFYYAFLYYHEFLPTSKNQLTDRSAMDQQNQLPSNQPDNQLNNDQTLNNQQNQQNNLNFNSQNLNNEQNPQGYE